MKKIFIIVVALIAWFTTSGVNAGSLPEPDSTGMPGDNFDLRGAIEIFKNSDSPEDFEKKLNAEDNKVNNLDLNEDGDVDYIMVYDKSDSKAHILILRVAVNENEMQDIAAIEIEKDGDESARLEITGSEDLYGSETYYEPIEEKEKAGTGKGAGFEKAMIFVSVNVWPWHCVRYIYSPGYIVWVSPWKWRHYPGWWHPRRPHAWRVYYGFHRPWHIHYRVLAAPRVVVAHKVYYAHRVSSPAVHARYKTVNVNRRNATVNKTVNRQVTKSNKNVSRKTDSKKQHNAARKNNAAKTHPRGKH